MDTRLGDKMPDRRAVKWGDMTAGKSHLSDEWHAMEACDPVFSEKWDAQSPSTPRMSEKWVDQDAGNSPFSNEWHEMKQERRMDPYSLSPNYEDRSVGMKKQSDNPMKNEGHGRYTISGSEGQNGKGL